MTDNESLLITDWRAKPHGFVSLMALYESNYLRLRRLCGDPARLAGERVSQVAGCCDLRLQVQEQAAYTTTFQLTHLFPEAADLGASHETFLTYPDVRVRVYCDARLAEARFQERELQHRWASNKMLNKWLEYCLDLGHRLG
jgi:uncharacterized protein